ncbi:DinB family protein [Mucilaginibacter dorajii]|uniref:DinB-like domain-containing protein n=1 Tax=Mucilaginibacter dorajii TaxID=692994 RepID=A0ABP7P7B8_9SPHI|nr:DinB family protein [Mucilaginibacter dorajii]MCS3736561.1 hypothetical protein [Mucilaginibacter dorajii]
MKDQQSNLPQPLAIELQSTAKDLIAAIEAISNDDFNSAPFEGKWSAGENAEHVRLSVEGAPSLLKGPAAKTNRAPDEHVNAIKTLFLDFNAKYPSAPGLIPAAKQYDKQTLIKALTAAFDEVAQVLTQLDLTDTCTAAEFNGIGKLSRLEWISVAVYHTQRHTYQLELIESKLKEKAAN